MRFYLLGIVLVSVLCAKEISPYKIIEASGNVQSIVMDTSYIIAGTNAGSIEVYHKEEGTLSQKIVFEKIKDFTGESSAPKVFSVDVLNGSTTYLAVVQASNGARRLVLVENGVQKELIDADKNLFINKAKFIDKDHVLVALMSSEFFLLNTKTLQKRYQVQLSYSHFSDFSLNESKTLVASSSESGEIVISDVFTGKVITVLNGGNVDNVYKVDYKQQKVLCAGQDRRGIVYEVSSKQFKRFDAPFLIYAGALSPSATLGAFAFNEENDIVIFDLASQNRLHTLKGQKSTLNTIVFVNEKELISGSDDKYILIWRLP